MDKHQWHDDEVRALAERGLTLENLGPLDRFNRVRPCYDSQENFFVAKATPRDSSEAAVLRSLIETPHCENRVVPAELVDCQHSTLVIMPFLRTLLLASPEYVTVEQYLHLFTQMIEGLNFMHERNIAFGDIDAENIVWSVGALKLRSFKIDAHALYYIDFGAARRLSAGPGKGITISDYRKHGGHYRPPEGVEDLDPYAYDVYSLGETLYNTCRVAQERYSDFSFPPCLHKFIDTLRSPNPIHRPSMRVVRQQWSELRNCLLMTKDK
ncbi:hypothetical protein EIP91_000585 [Steccherinum ochraceum]|uniref:non-specific serine/threonine protein kinase n=1 Tax=Steccherinum ochraceum TaxID=92696 RepID=A0A4R0RIY5_9APHY|nr:hypothetical protein EIP91_000585 [Steccherinum ochraceum]